MTTAHAAVPAQFFSTRELAEFVGVPTGKVRRLFEDRTLPEPRRFSGRRAIPSTMVPIVVDALRSRGWLPFGEAAPCK
jgi:hypothetical protein